MKHSGPKSEAKCTSGLIKPDAIRSVVKQIAQRFDPERIVLFGSYARGNPHLGSDLDLLVIMPARNEIDQALRIEESLDSPLPLDILVRTPHNLTWRLREGDWFLREVMEQGRVVYEQTNAGVGPQSRSRPRRGSKDPKRSATASR